LSYKAIDTIPQEKVVNQVATPKPFLPYTLVERVKTQRRSRQLIWPLETGACL